MRRVRRSWLLRCFFSAWPANGHGPRGVRHRGYLAWNVTVGVEHFCGVSLRFPRENARVRAVNIWADARRYAPDHGENERPRVTMGSWTWPRTSRTAADAGSLRLFMISRAP